MADANDRANFCSGDSEGIPGPIAFDPAATIHFPNVAPFSEFSA
ncbi:MAG TPA: hypothetical protein VFO40_18960 [Chthoniobacterales bacterium]|nr:hypothetical protein [Chthoniobacterales bacterium]